MRSLRCCITFGILALVHHSPEADLEAQAVPLLRPGVRVRVSTAPQTSQPDWLVGTVTDVSSDRLTIRSQRDSAREMQWARKDLVRLEVSRGRRSHWLTGLGLGFLAGGAVGAAIGYQALHEGHDLAPRDAALMGAIPGAVGGGLIGLAIGSGSKSERWQAIPVTMASRGRAHQRQYALGVSLHLRFRTW